VIIRVIIPASGMMMSAHTEMPGDLIEEVTRVMMTADGVTAATGEQRAEDRVMKSAPAIVIQNLRVAVREINVRRTLEIATGRREIPTTKAGTKTDAEALHGIMTNALGLTKGMTT